MRNFAGHSILITAFALTGVFAPVIVAARGGNQCSYIFKSAQVQEFEKAQRTKEHVAKIALFLPIKDRDRIADIVRESYDGYYAQGIANSERATTSQVFFARKYLIGYEQYRSTYSGTHYGKPMREKTRQDFNWLRENDYRMQLAEALVELTADLNTLKNAHGPVDNVVLDISLPFPLEPKPTLAQRFGVSKSHRDETTDYNKGFLKLNKKDFLGSDLRAILRHYAHLGPLNRTTSRLIEATAPIDKVSGYTKNFDDEPAPRYPTGPAQIVAYENGRPVTKGELTERKQQISTDLTTRKLELPKVNRESTREHEIKVKLSELAKKMSPEDRETSFDFIEQELFGGFGHQLVNGQWRTANGNVPIKGVLPYLLPSELRPAKSAEEIFWALQKQAAWRKEGDIATGKIDRDGVSLVSNTYIKAWKDRAYHKVFNETYVRGQQLREHTQLLIELALGPLLVLKPINERPIILVEKQINTVAGLNPIARLHQAIKLPSKYRQQSTEDAVAIETLEEAKAYLKRQAFVELTKQEQLVLSKMRSANAVLEEPFTMLSKFRLEDIQHKLLVEKVKADESSPTSFLTLDLAELRIVQADKLRLGMVALSAVRESHQRTTKFLEDVNAAESKLRRAAELMTESVYNLKIDAVYNQFSRARTEAEQTIVFAESQLRDLENLANAQGENALLNKQIAQLDSSLKQAQQELKVKLDEIDRSLTVLVNLKTQGQF